jgi:hypothetical protein
MFYIMRRRHVCDRAPTFHVGAHICGLSYLAGMSPYISLKIKKRHYEHHMIEAHKYLITWISDDISFENSG